MAKNISMVSDILLLKPGSRKRTAHYTYQPTKMFERKIPPEAHSTTQKMFVAAHEELKDTIFDIHSCNIEILKIAVDNLGKLEFDLDAGTKKMIVEITNSDIRFGISKFLETVF